MAISTITGVFHFMAISLDLHLLVHAISDLETCQLRVPPVSVAHEIPGFVADDLSVFWRSSNRGIGMLLGISRRCTTISGTTTRRAQSSCSITVINGQPRK